MEESVVLWMWTAQRDFVQTLLLREIGDDNGGGVAAALHFLLACFPSVIF
jgi:hypothetical protein